MVDKTNRLRRRTVAGVSRPLQSDLVVVKVVFPTAEQPEPTSGDKLWAHLSENVKGTAVALTDDEIAKTTDWPKVRKYYKLNGSLLLEAAKSDQERAKEARSTHLDRDGIERHLDT